VAAVVVLVTVVLVGTRLVRTGFTGLGDPNLPCSVPGTQWRLATITAAGRTVTPAAGGGVPATLELDRHRFEITGDCNDESGQLSVSGTKLTFRVDQGSLVACGASPIDSLLSGLVNGSAHYATAPGKLTLKSDQATFVFAAPND
jgi:heat shock protein HslJ